MIKVNEYKYSFSLFLHLITAISHRGSGEVVSERSPIINWYIYRVSHKKGRFDSQRVKITENPKKAISKMFLKLEIVEIVDNIFRHTIGLDYWHL